MVNKVMLIGRLGRDPEARTTSGGAKVVNFSMATDEKWKDASGEQKQRTEWHNIVAWNKLAEICERFLAKGKLVYLEGKLQTREYEDRDGNKRKVVEIIASEMRMLEKSAAAQEDRPAPAPRTADHYDEDDF